jgi:hypothetical protein
MCLFKMRIATNVNTQNLFFFDEVTLSLKVCCEFSKMSGILYRCPFGCKTDSGNCKGFKMDRTFIVHVLHDEHLDQKTVKKMARKLIPGYSRGTRECLVCKAQGQRKNFTSKEKLLIHYTNSHFGEGKLKRAVSEFIGYQGTASSEDSDDAEEEEEDIPSGHVSVASSRSGRSTSSRSSTGTGSGFGAPRTIQRRNRHEGKEDDDTEVEGMARQTDRAVNITYRIRDPAQEHVNMTYEEFSKRWSEKYPNGATQQVPIEALYNLPELKLAFIHQVLPQNI